VDADADAAQLIRVQQIATEVVRADSLLTSGFPSPELQTAAQVAAFDTALANAAQLVAEAAAANPSDGAGLAHVSDALGQYRQYATNARTYNAQGQQVGLGYLRQASAALRGPDKDNPNLISGTGTGMLPALDALIRANAGRVDSAYSASGWATVRMVVADLLALAGLVLVQVWLARRTRRYLNVPLAAATAGVLVVLVVGAAVMIGAQSRADRVRSTSYTALTSLADARIAANEARSDASISFLYLRTGGSFTSYRADYSARIGQVDAALNKAGTAAPSAALGDFTTWRTAADKMFDTTTRDRWVAVAHGIAQEGDPFNKPFLAFDTALGDGIDAQGRAVGTGLGDGNLPLIVLTWLTLGLGVVAALVAWGGIAQRLEDYR